MVVGEFELKYEAGDLGEPIGCCWRENFVGGDALLFAVNSIFGVATGEIVDPFDESRSNGFTRGGELTIGGTAIDPFDGSLSKGVTDGDDTVELSMGGTGESLDITMGT